jgi:hypothetical protein
MHTPVQRGRACWASRWIRMQQSRPWNGTRTICKRICTSAL